MREQADQQTKSRKAITRSLMGEDQILGEWLWSEAHHSQGQVRVNNNDQYRQTGRTESQSRVRGGQATGQ